MSYTVLSESLGNVPLLRLYNPQPFEDRICHQLQVEWRKEELNCGGPMLVKLNMSDYIQNFRHGYDHISLPLSFETELIFWHRSFTFNSNKSPTWCNNFSVYYLDVCLQLNMLRAFSRPAGPTTKTTRLSPRYEGKTRGCHCSHWAPDDGR